MGTSRRARTVPGPDPFGGSRQTLIQPPCRRGLSMPASIPLRIVATASRDPRPQPRAASSRVSSTSARSSRPPAMSWPSENAARFRVRLRSPGSADRTAADSRDSAAAAYRSPRVFEPTIAGWPWPGARGLLLRTATPQVPQDREELRREGRDPPAPIPDAPHPLRRRRRRTDRGDPLALGPEAEFQRPAAERDHRRAGQVDDSVVPGEQAMLTSGRSPAHRRRNPAREEPP